MLLQRGNKQTSKGKHGILFLKETEEAWQKNYLETYLARKSYITLQKSRPIEQIYRSSQYSMRTGLENVRTTDNPPYSKNRRNTDQYLLQNRETE